MADEYDNMKNYNIAVKKRGDDITFLRKIVPGAADDSYGIEVAKLAGIPNSVIVRAKEILKNIESKEPVKHISIKTNDDSEDNVQLEFSKSYDTENEIVKKLKDLDVSVLTPIESINVLYGLIKLANKVEN